MALAGASQSSSCRRCPVSGVLEHHWVEEGEAILWTRTVCVRFYFLVGLLAGLEMLPINTKIVSLYPIARSSE
ncbi:hypothetical protein TRIUR3_27480 [Triticum urartu]|uniref:Uncharacterized protein n=1 Tax=Triticum urartu TaxID=4572 RepID=M8A8B0_TRIUA|nr:hypothetical protein TRIUR3_27480 [Triticum urartu]